MKVAVVYGTNREKAMVKVVEWLRRGFESEGIDTTVGRPSDFDSLDYDLIVIGSSIYGRKAVDEILEFLQNKHEELSKTKIATYLVCKTTDWPEVLMVQILERLSTKPMSQMFIEGYMFREKNFGRQESKALEWTTKIVQKIK